MRLLRLTEPDHTTWVAEPRLHGASEREKDTPEQTPAHPAFHYLYRVHSVNPRRWVFTPVATQARFQPLVNKQQCSCHFAGDRSIVAPGTGRRDIAIRTNVAIDQFAFESVVLTILKSKYYR